jgi:NTE family protein
MAVEPVSPPSWLAPPSKDPNGIALALSGGGFRATLFHLGVAERLHQLGVLQQTTYLSSVSGGSILAAVLARCWPEISGHDQVAASNFEALVAKPIVEFVGGHVRDRALRRALLRGNILTGRADALVDVLADLLFGKQTMGELPPAGPTVALNAASLRTGKRFRFSRLSMGDYHMGYTDEGQGVAIARAVVASAAFPPIFAPISVDIRGPVYRWSFGEAPVCYAEALPRGATVSLVDGGVYENVGLLAAKQRCGRVIAVDAGYPPNLEMPPVEGLLATALRSIELLMTQVVSLPVSQFVDELRRGTSLGCFVRISHTVDHLANDRPQEVAPSLSRPPALSTRVVGLLARLRTDLNHFSDLEIDLLRYHGASVADVAVRRFQPQLISRAAPDWNKPMPAVSLEDEDRLQVGANRPLASVFRFWQGC